MRPDKLFIAPAVAVLVLALGACSSQPTPTVTVTAPAPQPSAVVAEPPADAEREAEPEPVNPSDVPSYKEPSNPVAILKEIPSCKLEEGVVAGDTDIFGNRFADCTIGDTGQRGHNVSVRTYPGDPRIYDIDPDRNLKSDDSRTIIIGEDFTATVSAIYAGTRTDKAVVAQVQEAIGGEIVEPSLD